MAYATSKLWNGEATAFILNKEKGTSIYYDQTIYYVFNDNKDIIGFVILNETLQDPEHLKEWFKTLISSHLANSKISYLQKAVVNNENIHNTNQGLLEEYNSNLINMELANKIELDQRKQTI